MKTAQIVAGFAIFAGLAIAYNGWANEPPPEDSLAKVSGQIVQVERVTRTRWSRRRWFSREEYVGHDISVRTEDDGVITVEAQGDAHMWRCTVAESFDEEAEFLADLIIR